MEKNHICKKCGGIAGWDSYFQSWICTRCGNEEPKPLTNYDQLISKTPEEMAVWFCECMLDCCGCPAFGKCIKYDGDANERSKTAPGLVDWLKAPVEVDKCTSE